MANNTLRQMLKLDRYNIQYNKIMDDIDNIIDKQARYCRIVDAKLEILEAKKHKIKALYRKLKISVKEEQFQVMQRVAEY